MILSQHYLSCLSQASYLIGDESTGRAVVVDPRRDVGVYLDEAAQHGLLIERVIETHIHADFLSGHLELAARTGAVISYGEGAQVRYPVDLLKDGQRISLGEVIIEVLATPGHTPESICLVVWEREGNEAPYGVLTGDTLFVGDVGRPDLLASAVPGSAGPVADELTAERLARQLYRSLHEKLLVLPPSTRVFPAHGAGSSCGRQISTETTSTIGDQRRQNYALQYINERDFVAAVTEGQPPRPAYFAYDASANRELHGLLDESGPLPLGLDEVLARQQAGAVLLDAREPANFAAGHLKGALNIGLQGRFAEWAGDVLPRDRDIVLTGDAELGKEARIRLGRVGLDRVVGQLTDLATVFSDNPGLVVPSSRLAPAQLAKLLEGQDDAPQIVDVRSPSETAAGTVPGALPLPLAVLAEHLGDLDQERPVVVYCASGYRSQIAASLIASVGFADVSDLLGGYSAWTSAVPAAP